MPSKMARKMYQRGGSTVQVKLTKAQKLSLPPSSKIPRKLKICDGDRKYMGFIDMPKAESKIKIIKNLNKSD